MAESSEQTFTMPADEAGFQQAAGAGGEGAAPEMPEIPEVDPKDTFHLLEDGTNFYLIAGLFIAACVVAFLIYRYIYKTFFKESIFSSLSDEYNLKLPPEIDEYYEFKEKLPDTLTENHIKELKNQLMKRAINDIPMILYMQDKSPGTYRLYHKAMIDDKAWKNFQRAEQLVCDEIEQVQTEAEEIEKGWGEQIWAQAMQLRKILLARQNQQEKEKEMAKQQKVAQKREKEKLKKKEKKAAEKIKSAEEIAAELIAEEEKNSK
mmetsp:Transcript_13512/g.17792  ORF Transcript_13512/g.17792 Transcript_13512/m.17792 type:complete len:263 (+) Transcript_13512:88-876(+)